MSDSGSPVEPLDNPSPAEDIDNTNDAASDVSDLESQLSEVDEAQFEDFDPTAVPLADRQAIPIDESDLTGISAGKRKRAAGEDDDGRKKKKKEGRREKPKRQRKRREGSEPFSGGEEMEGKRVRKPGRPDGERRVVRREEVDEDTLTPEERRKRALDRAMDEALRNPNQRRRRKGEIDLDALQDQEIEEMRTRMAKAAEADTDARAKGQPASHKLAMLPEVVALLNRNTLRHQIVDPDINLLESVRFFLEPLNDGSLPAYNIQKELFLSLAKLPINKDTLIASGIGKVVLFYTKSTRAEPPIKRQAERLVTRWTSLLKRPGAPVGDVEVDETGKPVALPSRGRVVQGAGVYSIAPQSNVVAGVMGKSGTQGEYMRRLKMKTMGKGRR